MNKCFNNAEAMAQFRRNIKYLKRWKDVNFSSSGNSAPRGIALTIAAYYKFIPVVQNDGTPDDVQALISFIDSILSSVQTIYSEEEYVERYVAQLPVEPFNDLFGKMTNKQMGNFLKQLKDLRQVLFDAQSEQDELKATLYLSEVFGDDFPSPDVNKAFEQVKKPSLGYYPTLPTISGYDYAPYNIEVKGHVFVHRKWIPISSNKRVLRKGRFLQFVAKPEIENVDFYWRVANTGKHVLQKASQINDNNQTFRGAFEHARVISFSLDKVEITPSKDPLITQEMTEYTGKHWIECVAVKNGICVGRSKRFYVNIFNEMFDIYD